MNKKAIWVIIGLMSAALLGIVLMQVNWISHSLMLNEEDFNNKVLFALNKVAERLEIQEQLEALSYTNNGFARTFYEQEMLDHLNKGNLSVTLSMESSGLPASEVHLSKTQYLKLILESNTCTCADCQRKRAENLTKWISFNRSVERIPVAERINLQQLDQFLKEELQDQGIKLEYKYGVYDNHKRCFVIANGHYVVEHEHPHPVKAGYQSLSTSPYRVHLYKDEKQSPGMLLVYFPDKTSYLWSTVLKNVVAVILFLSIIMGCFAYTVWVIFRQKKLSEMKNDFINNMTHEFKTPIATISLATDSITSPVVAGDPSKVRRFADIIKQENQRMNNQVERVLQMAAIDRGDFQLKLSDVNLHEVIARAVDNISLQVERKNGRVSTQLEAERPVVQGDLTHISNIVNNLLDNANKYSPENPEISVSTRNVPDGVEVIVSDNGIGMSKEARKHIFDKFYRVHTGNLHDVKGFGLGLSYVKALMDAHKGRIQVKSEPGVGSSFILFFPFQVGTSQPGRVSASA